ncbi:MAG TPA: hypothetical protein GXX15_04575 [Clostridia bacterium]|nr:hypothetical protein [Clostridia bacterium]
MEKGKLSVNELVLIGVGGILGAILLSWLTIILIFITLSGTLFVPKQRIGFIGGIIILSIFFILYSVAQKSKIFDR